MSRLSISYRAGRMASILTVLFLVCPVHAETETTDTWQFRLGTYACSTTDTEKKRLACASATEPCSAVKLFGESVLTRRKGHFCAEK